MNKRKQQAALLAGIFTVFTILVVLMGASHVAVVFGIAALIALYDFWKGGVLP